MASVKPPLSKHSIAMSSTFSAGATGPVGSNTYNGPVTAGGINGTAFQTMNGNSIIGHDLTSSLHVASDAKFDGNILWKGRDLGKMLETIEKRLSILVPNPKKLEKYEALQKAYDHYKVLEALCEESNE
jgi:hypothetical protein